MNEFEGPVDTSTTANTEAGLTPAERKRIDGHLAFWSVRAFNPRRQRVKSIRRSLPQVRTRQGRGGKAFVVSRRTGLSGRQWVRLRKELTKAAALQAAGTSPAPGAA